MPVAKKTAPKAAKKKADAAEVTTGVAKPPKITSVDSRIKQACQSFGLLADETRMRIILYLGKEGEKHVTDICTHMGQSQPAVSHHLALLRVSGLIEPRREGKHNFYSVVGDELARIGEEILLLGGMEHGEKIDAGNLSVKLVAPR